MGKGLAIAAFVLTLLFWIPLIGVFLVIAGIVLGIISLVIGKKDKNSGKGLAIAAIIIGTIIIIILAGILTFFLRPDFFTNKVSINDYPELKINDYPELKDHAYRDKYYSTYYGSTAVYNGTESIKFDNSATIGEIARGQPNIINVSYVTDFNVPYHNLSDNMNIYCNGKRSEPKLYYSKYHMIMADSPNDILIEVVDCGQTYWVYENSPDVYRGLALFGPFEKTD